MTVTLDDDLFGSTKVDSGAGRSGDFDDLFSEPPPKPRQPPPKAAKPQAPPTDDLFAEAPTKPKTTSTKPKTTPTKPKTTPTKPKTTPTKDDLFTSDTQPPRTETKPRAEPDNPPEDIFATAKATKVAKVDKDDIWFKYRRYFLKRRQEIGLDDLFATEVPKTKPTEKEVKSEKVVREEPKREDVGGREEVEQPCREEVDTPQSKPKTEKVYQSVLP